MKCPECGSETLYFGEVIDAETPCLYCGYDMGGVRFYNEPTSDYASIKE